MKLFVHTLQGCFTQGQTEHLIGDHAYDGDPLDERPAERFVAN